MFLFQVHSLPLTPNATSSTPQSDLEFLQRLFLILYMPSFDPSHSNPETLPPTRRLRSDKAPHFPELGS